MTITKNKTLKSKHYKKKIGKKKQYSRKRTNNRKKVKRTKRKRKQSGGNPQDFLKNITFTLIVFWVLFSILLKKAVIQPTIDQALIPPDVNIGYASTLMKSETLGISLVPLSFEEYTAYTSFCEKKISLVLNLNDSQGIESYFDYYPKYYQNYVNSLGQERESYVDDYNNRSVEEIINTRSLVPQNIGAHTPQYENDLHLLYQGLLPSLKLLTNDNIPRRMYVSGAHFQVSFSLRIINQLLSTGGDSPWHQDINPGNMISPHLTNRDIRVFIIPQGQKPPEFASQVGEYFPKSNEELDAFGNSGFYSKENKPRRINLKIDGNDYIAIAFNNLGVFHRTPPMELNDYFLSSPPREVYQLVFKWNDRDGYCPQSESELTDSLSDINMDALNLVDENMQDKEEILSSLSEATNTGSE